jgi:putative ABC transport system substrate-binding protein
MSRFLPPSFCALLLAACPALAADLDLGHARTWADGLPDLAGLHGGELRTMTLAQLEDQLRRPETQGTLGRSAIAILYPSVEEPWRSAFLNMIKGIEERTRVHVRSYAIDGKMDVYDLNAQLKRNGTRVVIALGRQGISTAAGLDRDITVLAGGALLSDSENLTGISLTPDPALLFARLRALLPDTRRVLVVFDPAKSEWLVRLARDAARAQGLELVAVEAHDLGQAAHAYTHLFNAADPRRDALWLPHDSTTVDETTVLPLVLKQSWNSGVPLFSSNMLHVKKGALFALTANHLELGHALGSSALGIVSGENRKRGIQPLRELYAAINLRTASHMGLTLGPQQQRSFDYIFPEP